MLVSFLLAARRSSCSEEVLLLYRTKPVFCQPRESVLNWIFSLFDIRASHKHTKCSHFLVKSTKKSQFEGFYRPKTSRTEREECRDQLKLDATLLSCSKSAAVYLQERPEPSVVLHLFSFLRFWVKLHMLQRNTTFCTHQCE
ncbi:hypothetical protein AMECASPLE_025082 [Ameca splendens]|uniref:Secreted protein n=1 Tax=Ameca splendens TaxID=208324 RepID=A0ABV0XTG8_9TELE